MIDITVTQELVILELALAVACEGFTAWLLGKLAADTPPEPVAPKAEQSGQDHQRIESIAE